MKSIIFFNHYHNGDLYHSKPFVKDIMDNIKTEYYYYHHKDFKITKDISIKMARVEGLSDKITILDTEEVVFVNTWIGAYFEMFSPGECTLNFNYKMYGHIYNELNNILGTYLQLKPIQEYYPFVVFENYDCDDIDMFVMNDIRRKILISNGPGLSGQCIYNGDMADIINELSRKYTDNLFIVTSKIFTENKNVVYTGDIIKENGNDLNEISYLATYCDLIIGRNSGPFCFSFNQVTINDPNKTFLAFGDRENDCFLYNNVIQCNLIFEKFTTEEKLKYAIEDQINKMSKSPCVTICEYEDERKVCKGCGRTDQEITEWATASKERKREINKAARARKSG